jgi:hypothetical protein
MINNNPSPVMGGEQKELITRLIVKIDNSIGDLDDVSWGMEEGVLISKRDALSIIALLQASPTPVEPSGEPMRRMLEAILKIEDVAFSLPGFNVKRLKSDIQSVLDNVPPAINSGDASVAKYISISHNAQIPADKNAIPRTAASIERYLAEQGIKLTMVQGSELHRLVETGMRSYSKHKCPMCNHDLSERDVQIAADKQIIKQANKMWPPEPKEKPAQPKGDFQRG